MVDVSHIGFGGKEGAILKQESFLFVMLEFQWKKKNSTRYIAFDDFS